MRDRSNQQIKMHAHSFTKISAFDLDHTLLKANSSYQFGKYLFQQNFFSFSTMLCLVGYYWLHKAHLLSMAKMQTKIFKKLFLGRSYCSIQPYVSAFLDNYFHELLYFPALDKLKEAQKEGHYTIILSSSPDFLVQAFAKRFKVTEWGATIYQLDDNNHFIALSKLMQGPDKAAYVNALEKSLKISKENITAYSDSILDTPFLHSAGRAIAVRPDRWLRALCKKNNWQIL